MTDLPDMDKKAAEESKRLKIRVANMEADVAYFQARLEILGEPATANQRAQHKAYDHLRKGLGDLVLKTKRRMLESG